MKRILTILFAVLLALALIGCGDDGPKKGKSAGADKEKKSEKKKKDEPADEPEDEPAEDPSEDPAEDPSTEPTDDPTEAPADDPAADPADKPAAATEVEKVDPADEVIDNPVVARVNGVDVDATEYFERLARITKKRGAPITKRMLTKNTVDRLINDKLLELELAKLGEPITDEAVASSLGMDMERFAKTKDKMKARIDSERKKLAVAKLLTARSLLDDPSDEDLKKEYGKRRMIRLNVVNFKVAQKAPAEDEAKSKANADAFLAAVQGGKDFKEAAKELSDDKLGRRAVRPMIVRDGEERHADMWAAATALEEKQFGGPVRTRFGFSVFEVVKKIEPKYTYEEMKERLKKTVVSQQSIKAKKTLIEELRKDAKIEYLVDFPSREDRPGLIKTPGGHLTGELTAPRNAKFKSAAKMAGEKAMDDEKPAPAPVPEKAAEPTAEPAPAPAAATAEPAPAPAPEPAEPAPAP